MLRKWFPDVRFICSIILIVFLILILEGTLYDVIVSWRSRKEADKEKTEETSSNSSDSNYKLRAENGVIQQPKPQKKRSPSNIDLLVYQNWYHINLKLNPWVETSADGIYYPGSI
jgi:hypothetical protein